jgi:mutator protein MutT
LSKTEQHAVVHVVAGVLSDAYGRVLLAERPAGKHLAGGWEFPGGKLEAGEERLEGLRRELLEEIGVIVQAARPLIRIRHAYPDRDIDLDVWLVTVYRGEPRPLDGQRLRWCEHEALTAADLLPADAAVVTALRLPERIVASAGSGFRIVVAGAPRGAGAADLVGVLCDRMSDAMAAATAGTDFVVLRQRLQNAQVAAICAAVGVPVFAHGIALPEAWALGAIGVSDLCG